VYAPSTSADSFWVRMDDGAWIKWNNIPSGCADVRNSDLSGSPVNFSLGAGSHRLEFAYREDGARLTNIVNLVTSLNTVPQCDD
jgi:hypothetical protein